jgi:hypothetical protein
MVAAQHQSLVAWDETAKLQDFGWASVSVQTIFDSGVRLDARVYATEAQRAKSEILHNAHGCTHIKKLAKIWHCSRQCRHEIESQRAKQRMWTAARNDDAFLA